MGRFLEATQQAAKNVKAIAEGLEGISNGGGGGGGGGNSLPAPVTGGMTTPVSVTFNTNLPSIGGGGGGGKGIVARDKFSQFAASRGVDINRAHAETVRALRLEFDRLLKMFGVAGRAMSN